MNREWFERVKEIVVAAREHGPESRPAFLESACGGDRALRAEVESLLAHEPDTPRALRSGGSPGQLAAALAERLEPVAPERIGPYRIREILGEGGMGVVYRAEQDEPIRREVALKLIRRGLDTDRVVARFEAERQALALMDHPAIARVIEAGATREGPPYFVMELVRGEPITAFCDARRLPIRERLDLFLAVCQGVQHAHQKGVIHRDLKPSNILVRLQDGRPAPKIIDFGIAKAIEEPAGAGERLTTQGQFIGTPEYMSPEQAGAIEGGVDTRSDVFALGVLLYELLTGRRPYRFRGPDPREIARVITDEAPARPSTAVAAAAAHREPREAAGSGDSQEARAAARRTTPARLRRELRGDLDNIVLMALRKEPARRYPSVEQFAGDVARHLAGRTVAARPDTWTYRTTTFVRRHRVGVALAAGLVLWLAGLAITLAAQSARVARERDRARAAEALARTEAATSRQTSEFLQSLFQAANPSESRGRDPGAREILARGRERVERELAGQPVVQARMLHTLGDVYHALGDYDEARPLLEKALAIRRRELGPEHVEIAATLDLLGTSTHDSGELGASETYYREALAMRRKLLGDGDPDVAESTVNLAITLQARGDLAGAEPLYRQALAMNRTLHGAKHVEVAWAMNSLGWVLHSMARYTEAESLYRGAVAMQVELLGEPHPDVAATLNNLAGVRLHLGDYAEAETLFRRALVDYRALYSDGHVAVARAMLNLSRALRASGGYPEAERMARESLALCLRLVGGDHPYVSNHRLGLGQVLLDSGRADAAEREFRLSLAQRTAQRGAEDAATAASQEALGLALLDGGRPREAVSQLETALAVRHAKQGAGHPDCTTPLTGLGRIALARGDDAGAEARFREAVTIRRAAFGAHHPQVAEAESWLGRSLAAQGRLAEAEPLLAASLRELDAALLPAARARRQAIENLAVYYGRAGRPDRADSLRALAAGPG